MSTCDYWKPIPDGGIALPCSCGDDCDGTEVDRDLARLEVLSEFPHNPLGPVRMHRLADEIVRLREALAAATRVTNLRLVVTQFGDVCHRSLPYTTDAKTLQALARKWDTEDAHLAPHRVVRVALVEEPALEGPRD